MKKVFTFAVAALMTLGLAAQSVTESTLQVGGLTVPAATVSLQKDPKMVQDAMIQYLKENKLKPQKDDQGYYVCTNAFIEDIAINDINFYYQPKNLSFSTERGRRQRLRPQQQPGHERPQRHARRCHALALRLCLLYRPL